jgi:hypothetical protein
MFEDCFCGDLRMREAEDVNAGRGGHFKGFAALDPRVLEISLYSGVSLGESSVYTHRQASREPRSLIKPYSVRLFRLAE